MALTAGWVVGPVAGSFLAAQTSLRTMLLATAVCTLVQIVPLATLRTSPAAISTDQEASTYSAAPACARWLPLLAFTALYVLVYAGEPIKYAYLPIYMKTSSTSPPG